MKRSTEKTFFWGFALLILVAFFISGCSKPAETVSSTSNPEVNVGKLFTYDGCTVYRFGDVGYSHYFVKCEGQNSSTSFRMRYCGKNCRNPESITTEQL